MKEKLKKIIGFIANPRLLVCIALAWVITNGWSYVLFFIGTTAKIHWMTAVSSAYIAFLWLPISPEKLVTFAIALGLLKLLFPKDQKTLAILHQFYEKAKMALKSVLQKNRPTSRPIHRICASVLFFFARIRFSPQFQEKTAPRSARAVFLCSG